jgi:epoxide hydrolase-like predicted phosphatase
MPKIKSVIFDIGGVLALPKYSLSRFKQERLGKSFHEYMARKLRIDMDTWIDSVTNIIDDANAGKINKSQALAKMSRNLGASTKVLKRYFSEAYRKTFVKNMRLIRYAVNLKKNGYRVGILSDQWQVAKEVLVRPEYYEFFEPVIISCNVKMKKPDPRIYRLVLRKLKLKGNECIFVDNRKYNLIPARKLGMKTILFKNNLQCLKDLKKLGVKT